LERAKELLAEQGAKTPNLKTVATTDPQSRLMKTRVGFRAAYNAQAVVDDKNQIILAAEVTQQEADNAQLAPMLEQVRHNCGELPRQASADTGYWSLASLEYASSQGVDAYIPAAAKTPRQATALDGWTYDPDTDAFRSDAGEEMYFNRERERGGRNYRIYRKCVGGRKGRKGRKEVWIRTNGLLAEAMRAKLITPEGRAIYKRRQEIVEPVFGHLKACLGLQRLLLRGLQGARIEYLLACTAHNLGKIVRRQALTFAKA
jgi:transposase